MSNWLRFVEHAPAAKTKRWCVQTIDGAFGLGMVQWIARWRCYGFAPFVNTVYEQDCLRAIGEFCEQRTKEHKTK